MTDKGKTFVAAGVLAAAVGVYLEISYREKLETTERMQRMSGVPSGAASGAASGAPRTLSAPHASPGVDPARRAFRRQAP